MLISRSSIASALLSLDVGAGAGSTSKSVRSKASPSEAAGQDDMSVLLDK